MLPQLSMEQADRIASAAADCAKRNRFNPVAIHVIDTAGDVIVSKTMDGCPKKGIPEFAYGKAYSAISMQSSSRTFRDKYTAAGDVARYTQMLGMIANSGNKMNTAPGGVVLKTAEGQVIGAVGVSGAAGDEDEYCAMRGVIEANLDVVMEPSEHCCTTHKDEENEDYSIKTFD